MRGKRDIERELIFSEAKVESLEAQLAAVQEERTELRSQVTKLQDALVAARAPEAYRDQQIAKEEENRIPIPQEQIDRSRVVQQTTADYLRAVERPLDANDLDDLLSRSLMRNVEPQASLHGNDES